MSVGIKVDRQVLDAKAGAFALKIRDGLSDAVTLKEWLAGVNDSVLTDQNGSFKYTVDEVAALHAAVASADALASIANGGAPAVQNYPYLLALKPLLGIQ